MSDFKTRLRELRKASELTQEQFGEKVGVSKSAVSMWERGERYPDVSKFEEIADYFNVDMEYLVGKVDVEHGGSNDGVTKAFGCEVPMQQSEPVCISEEEDGVCGLCEFLMSNPEIKALTAAIREMTEEEIQELARYGKFLRARDGIK